MNAVSFHTVLVANRGEIARRVVRTLRRLGIRSVAVYSDADAQAPHVAEADVAVRIGPTPAAQSYLDIDAVIAAARETGAQAVHPGYGFLSENAVFARACRAAGIVFIGPGERALEVMGDKIRAKEHVGAHGVPLVPGFDVGALGDDDATRRAREIGYPVLVKPSAGGGGKGMQVARDDDEFVEALASARRIAEASFGDDALLVEQLIDRPRHIEVQVMADRHGTVVHLGERECTLQRRHQKVIEEAPSPIVDDATRARLGAAACAAARSVDYVGAGTVEFLVAADRPEEFFFIEMNTRLQVEHPVTELVTGLDLVELQLIAAAGGALPLRQDDVSLRGHAVEARVYAESPERGFLPATGDVLLWRAARGVRTDAAVRTGSAVTAAYDPMIAKVIARGPDRAAAWDALDDALAETIVLGVDTNIAFLRELCTDDAVRSADMDTGLIARRPHPTWSPPSAEALAVVAAREIDASGAPPAGASPWSDRTGWRLGSAEPPRFAFLVGDEMTEPVAADLGAANEVIAARDAEGTWWVHHAGRSVAVTPLTRRARLARRRAARRPRASAAASPQVRAPMPGAVVAAHVADGAVVAAGDRLVTVEAMKMEHPVTAPHAGRVSLAVAPGDQVRRDQVVATVTPAPEPEPEPAATAAD